MLTLDGLFKIVSQEKKKSLPYTKGLKIGDIVKLSFAVESGDARDEDGHRLKVLVVSKYTGGAIDSDDSYEEISDLKISSFKSGFASLEMADARKNLRNEYQNAYNHYRTGRVGAENARLYGKKLIVPAFIVERLSFAEMMDLHNRQNA